MLKYESSFCTGDHFQTFYLIEIHLLYQKLAEKSVKIRTLHFNHKGTVTSYLFFQYNHLTNPERYNITVNLKIK